MSILEVILLAFLGLFLLSNLHARFEDRKIKKTQHPLGKKGRWPPRRVRPVKRFKHRARFLWGKPKSEFAGVSGPIQQFRGKDGDSWMRLYPNPGYLIDGYHRCLRKHRSGVRWK